MATKPGSTPVGGKPGDAGGGGGGGGGGGAGTGSSHENVNKYPVVNKTQEAEDAYDLVRERNLQQPSGVIGTIAYIVKGALGAGILGSHVGFSKVGLIAIPVTIALSFYMSYCLKILVQSAQILYKRTAIPSLSYSEVGEAAFANSTSPKLRNKSRMFRILIDSIICLDLFGSCCCYQLMISGTIKQIVELRQETTLAGLNPSYPSLQMYMIIMMVPMIMICLVKNLNLLAKFSIFGNFLVVLCIFATVYYSLKKNPTMEGMKTYTNLTGLFTFMGMTVFSMSCSGIVIALEGNMKDPTKFPLALALGMIGITGGILTLAVFGYSAYGEDCKAPVTFHFPMELMPIMLKAGIALMLYITHAVNFWVPFNLSFAYLKVWHTEENQELWEYVYRGMICATITIVGIVFPSVNKLMSFIGAFCLSNMAFIFPPIIYLSVFWERPGLGTRNWRLYLCIFLIFVGFILFLCGTYVSTGDLVSLLIGGE